MAKMMDLGSIKKDFSVLLSQVQPWTLSHFVMWLDIKVAEYKVFGRMIMDNTPGDTPQWLRASADYLEQQHKEAQATAVFVPEVGQVEKDTTSPISGQQPPLSPRSATAAVLRSSLMQGMPVNQAMTTMTTSVSSLYTASTVTTTSTTVSPSVSPAVYAGVAQIHPPPPPVDAFQKQHVPISSPDAFLKSAAVPSPFQAFPPGTQRIPPISHLSPKHIRQSHMDQNLSMSLPVSIGPMSRNKENTKESLSTAEVESQIALLESQIAAVNRSLKQTSQITGVEPILQAPLPMAKHGRRKADSSSEDQSSYGPPPYPKKTRQQSPVSANRTSVESTSLPPLHSSMDMLARIHRLDTDSIPESLRSQNIQSTLEAFEALRTQTFPPNTEVVRPQESNDVETIQNTAQDMSMHHIASEREQQLLAFSAAAAVTSEREQQVYPVAVTPAAGLREQVSYTPSPTEREAGNNACYTTAAPPTPAAVQGSSVHVKVEAGQSDEDSVGEVHNLSAEEIAMHQAALQNAHDGSAGETYPVSMYTATPNESATADDKLAAEISTKKMRRKFLESMKNSNPKYYSHQIQQIIPFPEKFPVANLDYGLKALQMIQTGEITRAGKIQLIDTIFHELIKYTGLYPTPTQKMSVANAIVETFPTLAAKMKASHISPADSWYVILCDKFRNERRGLSGSPRVGRSPKVPKHDQDSSAVPTDQPSSVEPTEEVEIRTTEEEMADDSSQQLAPTPPTSVSQQTTPPIQQHNQQAYAAESAAAVAAMAAYHQAYTASQQLQLEDGLVLDAASTTSTKEHILPEMTSEEEEEEMGENERLVNMMNAEERKLYSWKTKRSVRRKTHSPKRVQKAEMPILDERYAASLLEYYSKHKPYYPGVDGDLSKAMEVESWKGDAGLVIDEKGGMSVPSTSQALAQAITSHAVGNPDEPYSAEVAAIVQSVVSAHMDEMLAARNYQAAGPQPGQPPESSFQILNQPQEVEGTVEVKTSKKKPKPQPIKTPEQLQVTMQRFKQKLGVTYPGVQVVDDCTLLCTCGTKVKLGRARMLHNYTNYHLKRCHQPPSTVHLDSHSPSSVTPGSIHSMYMGSPGEINIPTTGPKVITKEVESVTFAGLSAADKETIQKHFLLNIPVPTSEIHGTGSASIHDSQSLDLTMPVTVGQTPVGMVVSEGSDASVSMSHHQHHHHSSEPSTPQPTRLTSSDQSILTIPTTGQNHLTLHSDNVAGDVRPASAPVTVSSLMGDSQSLDLSVQTSGPSVLIEHQPGSDLQVQIPRSIATSIVEYSGELPDLSAMNALALIQGKVDQPAEAGAITSEEPMNLADS